MSFQLAEATTYETREALDVREGGRLQMAAVLSMPARAVVVPPTVSLLLSREIAAGSNSETRGSLNDRKGGRLQAAEILSMPAREMFEPSTVLPVLTETAAVSSISANHPLDKNASCGGIGVRAPPGLRVVEVRRSPEDDARCQRNVDIGTMTPLPDVLSDEEKEEEQVGAEAPAADGGESRGNSAAEWPSSVASTAQELSTSATFTAGTFESSTQVV